MKSYIPGIKCDIKVILYVKLTDSTQNLDRQPTLDGMNSKLVQLHMMLCSKENLKLYVYHKSKTRFHSKKMKYCNVKQQCTKDNRTARDKLQQKR